MRGNETGVAGERYPCKPVFERPKYACHHCEGSGDEDRPAVRVAPAPPALIEVARIGWTVRRVLRGVCRWLSTRPSLSRSGGGKGGGVRGGVNEPVYMWATSHARAPVRPRMPSHPAPIACRSCSLRHLLLTFRHPVTVGFRRRATGERRVRSLLVVEPDPLCDHPLRHEAIL